MQNLNALTARLMGLSTGLKPGEGAVMLIGNRFNGLLFVWLEVAYFALTLFEFGALRKPLKRFSWNVEGLSTGLKPGENET